MKTEILSPSVHIAIGDKFRSVDAIDNALFYGSETIVARRLEFH